MELYILNEKFEALESKLNNIEKMLTYIMDATMAGAMQIAINNDHDAKDADEMKEVLERLSDEAADIMAEYIEKLFDEEENYEDEEDEEDEN